jgi:hypothetical protein
MMDFCETGCFPPGMYFGRQVADVGKGSLKVPTGKRQYSFLHDFVNYFRRFMRIGNAINHRTIQGEAYA